MGGGRCMNSVVLPPLEFGIFSLKLRGFIFIEQNPEINTAKRLLSHVNAN